jgi:hypothetical protein
LSSVEKNESEHITKFEIQVEVKMKMLGFLNLKILALFLYNSILFL